MPHRPGDMLGPVNELVALDMAGGTQFTDELRRAWDSGDAVFPVDQRLPAPARNQLFELGGVHRVVDPSGSRRLAGGPAMEVDDAVVVASSGSSGTPKLVVHGHAGLRAHADASNSRLAVDPSRDRWLACLPLCHLGGLGVVIRALLLETPCDVIASFDADLVSRAPTELGTTLVSLVPTALDRLTQSSSSSFRRILLGGAADDAARPENVVHTYGMTETGGGVVYEGVPLDGVEVRFEQGQILLRTPTMANGFRSIDGDGSMLELANGGWLRTGDIGHWSPQGDEQLLVVDGRMDDLIISGGENVWPETVEKVLTGHPGIAEVAVVGRADQQWGQMVVAHVVAESNADPSSEDIRAFAREQLPVHAVPKEVVFTGHLERSALGKVLRGRLSE